MKKLIRAITLLLFLLLICSHESLARPEPAEFSIEIQDAPEDVQVFLVFPDGREFRLQSNKSNDLFYLFHLDEEDKKQLGKSQILLEVEDKLVFQEDLPKSFLPDPSQDYVINFQDKSFTQKKILGQILWKILLVLLMKIFLLYLLDYRNKKDLRILSIIHLIAEVYLYIAFLSMRFSIAFISYLVGGAILASIFVEERKRKTFFLNLLINLIGLVGFLLLAILC